MGSARLLDGDGEKLYPELWRIARLRGGIDFERGKDRVAPFVGSAANMAWRQGYDAAAESLAPTLPISAVPTPTEETDHE